MSATVGSNSKYRSQRNLSCYVPKRYIVALLGFFGLFNVFCMRVNMNVALVAMVNHSAHHLDNHSLYTGECPMHLSEEKEGSEVTKVTPKGGQYNWDVKTQGMIMSSFFYGYFVTVLTGGYLAERFGSKIMLAAGVSLTAILTLLTPLAVTWGLVPFLAVRAFQGIGEGVSYPAMNALISKWSPRLERSRISAVIYSGSPVGTCISLIVSGWLSNSESLGGWPSVFYVFGALGCIWVVFWIIFIHESPDIHPKISKEEIRLYHASNDDEIITKGKPVADWNRILRALPFWAILMSHIGSYFGQTLMITELPTYLHDVLHFRVDTSGFLTGLPSIAEAVGGVIGSIIADKLISSGKLEITTVRKIFNSIAIYGSGVCYLIISVSGCNAVLIIFLFTLFMFINGFKYSGYNVNHVDICPPLAGTLYGLTNGIACLSGIVAPTMVGAFLSNGETMANWNKVFYVTASVYFVTATFYAVFASSKPHTWIKTDSEKGKSNICVIK